MKPPSEQEQIQETGTARGDSGINLHTLFTVAFLSLQSLDEMDTRAYLSPGWKRPGDVQLQARKEYDSACDIGTWWD